MIKPIPMDHGRYGYATTVMARKELQKLALKEAK
jgi:hypothetical protein